MGSSGLPCLTGFGGDQIAGRYQTFFVCQADGLAGLHGFVSGFESGDADDGADHEVGVGMGRDLYRTGRTMYDLNGLVEPGLLQPARETGRQHPRRGHDITCGRQRRACSKASSTLLPAAMLTTEKRSGKLSTMLSVLLADGAGRAEDGNTFHEGFSCINIPREVK